MYHLEGLCVQLLVRVPQVGNHWCKVFTRTRNALDFKHASQQQSAHKYMKVHEDIYVAYIPTLAVLPGVEWGGNAWERLSFTFFTFCFK